MIKNLLLLLLSIVAALVLCEAILALWGIPKFYKPHNIARQYYYYLNQDSTDVYMYTNYPSSSIKLIYDGNPRGYFDKENTVSHNTNSSGFRGGEFVKEKDPNTFRIAFLGDSFTFGEGVKDGDTYSEKLKQILKKKYSSMNVECYNFGVGGYNTNDELFLLKNLVLQVKPDAVVLLYNLNDAEPKSFSYDKKKDTLLYIERGLKTNEIYPIAQPPQESMLFKLRTAKLAWQILTRRQITKKTTDYYLEMYKGSNSPWVSRQDSLKEFIRVCKDSKVDCYVMVFPLLFWLNDDYPFAEIHAKVKDAVEGSAEHYATFIDLFPAFKGKKDAQMWVHPMDQHPNEVGHEIVAQYLAPYIKIPMH